jgi:hypothetical protein
MALRIVRVHLEGGTEHRHIAQLEWYQYDDNSRKTSSRQTIVDWLERSSVNEAFTAPPTGYGQRVYVREQAGVKFIQTVADSQWSNNLLALPKF